MVFEYRGADRKGAGVTGRLTATLPELGEWVRRKFRQGWKVLEVIEVGEDELCAGIESPPFAPRIWWSI